MSMSRESKEATEWEQKPFGCQCLGNPCTCLLTFFCPCISYCQASRDINENCNGYIYLTATLLGFGCCALMALADDIATKRDIEITDFELCSKSFCNNICCFGCTVVNECKVYKNMQEMNYGSDNDDGVPSPQAQQMDDR